jgi:hypothetical protein
MTIRNLLEYTAYDISEENEQTKEEIGKKSRRIQTQKEEETECEANIV